VVVIDPATAASTMDAVPGRKRKNLVLGFALALRVASRNQANIASS